MVEPEMLCGDLFSGTGDVSGHAVSFKLGNQLRHNVLL